MEKIKLEFTSPRVLDNLSGTKAIEKTPWYYLDSESESLSIDVSDWTIHCANGKRAIVTEWFVNQETNRMALKENKELPEGYEAISYAFTVSMLGQLVEAKVLISFLSSIQEVFHSVESKKENPENQEYQHSK